jgi:recombinational DNA repair protein RecR
LEKVNKYWPTLSIVEDLFANTDERYPQQVFMDRLEEKALEDEWVKVIITEVEKMYISTTAEVIQQKMSRLRLW